MLNKEVRVNIFFRAYGVNGMNGLMNGMNGIMNGIMNGMNVYITPRIYIISCSC